MDITNEELALAIQQGDYKLLEHLWERVKPFVYRKAKEALAGAPPGWGVELDDLGQSGYIAMVAAAQTYDPGQSSFLHWLSFYLKHEFCSSGGYPVIKRITTGETGVARWIHRNPLNICASLDEPLRNTLDGEAAVLSDILPYEPASGVDEYEEVEEKIYRAQLRSALDRAIDNLPGKQASALKEHYWDGLAYREIAENSGVDQSDVARDVRAALQSLRTPRLRAELEQFLDERMDYYAGTGLQSFKRAGASSVERAVLRRENLAREWCRRI